MTIEMNQDTATAIAAGIERRWTMATLAQDIDALVDLFSSEAVFLGSLPTVFEGLDGVRQYFSSVDLKSTHAITWSDRHVRVLSPHIFTCLNHVGFHVQLPDQAMVFGCAFSWVVVNESGAWKIVQQHASVRP